LTPDLISELFYLAIGKSRQVITDKQEFSSTYNITDEENSELRFNLAL
jgi:hypothetical protein